MREDSPTISPQALKAEPPAGQRSLLSTAEAYELAKVADGSHLTSALPIRHRLFLLFFLSGFCGLVYQVVWTRLAFASFGIITPVLSVVISVFMLGLAIGSWAGGRCIPWLTRRTGRSAAMF